MRAFLILSITVWAYTKSNIEKCCHYTKIR